MDSTTLKDAPAVVEAACDGCSEQVSNVGPLARYRVRDLEGNAFVARYCVECAHVATTAVAFPGCGYGAVALPDTFVAVERLHDDVILAEQASFEARVLREADGDLVARLADGGAAYMVHDDAEGGEC